MGAHQAAAAQTGAARAPAQGGPARNPERDPLSGARGLRLAHAADPLRAVATVYWWFRRFVRRLLFRTLHDVALMLDRERAGREASPSAGVAEGRVASAPAAPGGGGYDAAKRVKGRKRHIAVSADGRLPVVHLTRSHLL